MTTAKKREAEDVKCICGKTATFSSSLLQGKSFCSDTCYERAQQGHRGFDEAKIFATSKGEAYFKQGDLMFSVDPKDLSKIVGENGRNCILDKLMDSQVVTLAQANGLPVQPFVRSLLKPVLVHLIQNVWYRDLEMHESENLKVNQDRAVATYLKALREYKEEDSPEKKVATSGKKVAVARPDKWTRTFKFTGKKMEVKGREKQVLDVVKSLKEGTFTKIVEAAQGKVATKQKLDKIVDRFLNRLVKAGAVEVKGGGQ